MKRRIAALGGPWPRGVTDRGDLTCDHVTAMAVILHDRVLGDDE